MAQQMSFIGAEAVAKELAEATAGRPATAGVPGGASSAGTATADADQAPPQPGPQEIGFTFPGPSEAAKFFFPDDMHRMDFARTVSEWRDTGRVGTCLYDLCAYREVGNHKPSDTLWETMKSVEKFVRFQLHPDRLDLMAENHFLGHRRIGTILFQEVASKFDELVEGVLFRGRPRPKDLNYPFPLPASKNLYFEDRSVKKSAGGIVDVTELQGTGLQKFVAEHRSGGNCGGPILLTDATIDRAMGFFQKRYVKKWSDAIGGKTPAAEEQAALFKRVREDLAALRRRRPVRLNENELRAAFPNIIAEAAAAWDVQRANNRRPHAPTAPPPPPTFPPPPAGRSATADVPPAAGGDSDRYDKPGRYSRAMPKSSRLMPINVTTVGWKLFPVPFTPKVKAFLPTLIGGGPSFMGALNQHWADALRQSTLVHMHMFRGDLVESVRLPNTLCGLLTWHEYMTTRYPVKNTLPTKAYAMQLIPQLSTEIGSSAGLLKTAEGIQPVLTAFRDAVVAAEAQVERGWLPREDLPVYIDEIVPRGEVGDQYFWPQISATPPGPATAGVERGSAEGRPLIPQVLTRSPVDDSIHPFSHTVLLIGASGSLAFTPTTSESMVDRIRAAIYAPHYGPPGGADPECRLPRPRRRDRLRVGGLAREVGRQPRILDPGGPPLGLEDVRPERDGGHHGRPQHALHPATGGTGMDARGAGHGRRPRVHQEAAVRMGGLHGGRLQALH